MEAAFAELPLACFTTLAPLGAGAFIALFLVNLLHPLAPKDQHRVDLFTLIPLGFLVLAFGLAFFHLANPLHAPFVLSGTITSPLSNELLAGSITLGLMVLYWILAICKRLHRKARLIASLITAVAGLLFSLFIGLAYYIDTIISWHTPLIWVQMVGSALMGAALTGSLVLASSQTLPQGTSKLTKMLACIGGVGLILFIGGFLWWIGFVTTLSNPLVQGAQKVSEIVVVIVLAPLCSVVGMGILFVLLHRGAHPQPRNSGQVVRGNRQSTPSLLSETKIKAQGDSETYNSMTILPGYIIAVLIAMGGIFLARLVFYALQLNVGL